MADTDAGAWIHLRPCIACINGFKPLNTPPEKNGQPQNFWNGIATVANTFSCLHVRAAASLFDIQIRV
jgi:hypothetical protein